MTLTYVDGQDLTARYTLLERLFEGEQHQRWLALDNDASERIEVTIYPDHAGLKAELQANVERARGLIHPGIVKVTDFGESGNDLFVVTRHLRGTKSLPVQGSLKSAWQYLAPVFDTLLFAHSLGFAHGHLAPEHIHCLGGGGVFIDGFELPGLPAARAYASPQVQAGQATDTSDDIYSMGAICFQLLTGQPYSPDAQFETDVPVPDEVRQIVMAMLDASAYSRAGKLDEIKEILERYAGDQSGAGNQGLESAKYTREQHTAPATQQPSMGTGREQRQLPVTLVASFTAILFVLALFVFFVLPGQVEPGKPVPAAQAPQTSPSESTNANPAATTQAAAPTPLEQARLEQFKAEGKELAQQIVRKQVELEDIGVLLWAGEEFNELGDRAQAADGLFRNEDFARALEEYEQVTEALDALVARAPEVLADNISRGETAFAESDPQAAIEAWTVANVIEPGQYDDELSRAESLEAVIDSVNLAEAAERGGDLAAALAHYKSAASMDPDWQPASSGVKRVHLAIRKANFSDAMSEGFGHLAGKRFEQAIAAFQRAEKLFPSSPEPADGILQVELAERMATIERFSQLATRAEESESWEDAINYYNELLAMDESLVFASQGLTRATTKQELYMEIDQYLVQPALMQTDDELSAARKLLVTASRIDNKGDQLKEKLSTLSRLISVARIPVDVTLTSDNNTEVTVYKVGDLGTLSNKTLELIPGEYTIVGKRRGYQDFYQKLTIMGGASIEPINVVCTEKI